MKPVKNDKSSLFTCVNCGKSVNQIAPGTHHRNHCPFCLYSSHVDFKTGDRLSACGGPMKPVGKFCKQDGEEVLVHECVNCGFKRNNRIAGDDSFDLVAALPDLTVKN